MFQSDNILLQLFQEDMKECRQMDNYLHILYHDVLLNQVNLQARASIIHAPAI